MSFLIALAVLITLLYFVNKASDEKRGLKDKGLFETLRYPSEIGVGNSILMWLIGAVAIAFFFWFIGLS